MYIKGIIAGSRNITNYELVALAVDMAPFVIGEVMSGGARGVDALGEKFARVNNLPLKVFPANWKKYGRGAGHIRNAEMADYADVLIAVWDGKSKGTLSMIRLANKANLRVFVLDVSKLENADV